VILVFGVGGVCVCIYIYIFHLAEKSLVYRTPPQTDACFKLVIFFQNQAFILSISISTKANGLVQTGLKKGRLNEVLLSLCLVAIILRGNLL